MSGESGKDHDTDTEDDRQYIATTNQMYILIVALLQQQRASRHHLEQDHDRHEFSDAAGVLLPAIGPKTFEESLAQTRMSHGGATRPRASRLQSSF